MNLTALEQYIGGKKFFWLKYSYPTAITGILVLIFLFLKLAFDNWSFLSEDFIPVTDAATDMLLVQQAPLGTLLTGHYTFLAVNHPGPFFLYIRYFAQIFPGSSVASLYGAHLFGMMATSAACAGVLATTLHRLTGSGFSGAVAAVTAVLMMLLQFAGQDALATLLMSDVVILPFLMFLATAMLLLRGSLFGLLSTTFAMMALVHAYIPLVPIVGIVWSTCALIGRRELVPGERTVCSAWFALIEGRPT
jgi:hypothetical protein